MVARTQDDGGYQGDVLGCLQVQKKFVVHMLCWTTLLDHHALADSLVGCFTSNELSRSWCWSVTFYMVSVQIMCPTPCKARTCEASKQQDI